MWSKGPSRTSSAGSWRVMQGMALAGMMFTAQAQAQTLAWGYGFGDMGDDVARSIAVDQDGNVIVAGYFEGAVDMDPGAGEVLLTSNGFNDIYVQKLSSDGALIWAFNIGGAEFDLATGVATDAAGNIYVTGGFTGTIDADPGAGVSELMSGGEQDILLAKYSSTGELVWARSFSGSGYDEPTAVAVAPTGEVHLVSYYSGSIDADPGTGVQEFSSQGNLDILMQRFNADGDLIWASSIGSANTELALSMAIDADGNSWYTGSFEGTLDLDPGVGETTLTSAGAWDIFVAKYSAAGDLLWAGRMGGVENFDTGYDIAVDAAGNAIVVGSFFASGDFDPSEGVHTLTASSMGSDEVFMLKLDPSGGFLWAKSIGGTDADLGYGVAVGDDNTIAITGFFSGTADLDPDPVGTFELTTASESNFFDAFVGLYSAEGDLIDAWQFAGANSIATQSIVRDGDAIMVAGHFESNPDLDPGAGEAIVESAGFRDAFVVRFNGINTGVAQQHDPVAPAVYPNPATDQVVIEVAPEVVGSVCTIFDEQGRVVSQGRIAGTRTDLHLDGFAAGRYQVIIHHELVKDASFVVLR